MSRKIKYILGIDEVGRGSIAGPITFCAFIMREDATLLEKVLNKKTGKLEYEKLKDSKKMTPEKRKLKSSFLNRKKIKGGECDFVLVSKSAEQIEKFGLSKIIEKSLNECILKIIKLNYNLDKEYCSIKLDGGLKFSQKFLEKIKEKYNYELNIETIIKGDEKIEAIAMASIKAKVTRDTYMHILSKKVYNIENIYYGWDQNAGYGTAKHYAYIKKYGLTKYHRKSWIK